MKAELFYGLLNLDEISLSGNQCIDEDFGENQIQALYQAVAENCGYCDDKNPTEMRVCQTTNQIQKNTSSYMKQLLENQKNIFLMLETFINKTNIDQSQNILTIAKLESEIFAAKEEIASLKLKFQKN